MGQNKCFLGKTKVKVVVTVKVASLLLDWVVVFYVCGIRGHTLICFETQRIAQVYLTEDLLRTSVLM